MIRRPALLHQSPPNILVLVVIYTEPPFPAPFDSEDEYVQFYISSPHTPAWYLKFLILHIQYEKGSGRPVRDEVDLVLLRLEDMNKLEWQAWVLDDPSRPPPQIITPPTENNYISCYGQSTHVSPRLLEEAIEKLMAGRGVVPRPMLNLLLSLFRL